MSSSLGWLQYTEFIPIDTASIYHHWLLQLFVNYKSTSGLVPHKPTLFNVTRIILGFQGSSAGKEYACNAVDPGSILGLGRSPGEEIGYPFQYSCLENANRLRSLASYSSWGYKSWTQLSDWTGLLSSLSALNSYSLSAIGRYVSIL